MISFVYTGNDKGLRGYYLPDGYHFLSHGELISQSPHIPNHDYWNDIWYNCYKLSTIQEKRKSCGMQLTKEESQKKEVINSFSRPTIIFPDFYKNL